MTTMMTFLASLFWFDGSQAACVKVDRANLRSGPGTAHAKTWEVFRYMPFRKVKKQGKWVLIKDLDGDRHWIHGKLITHDYKCAAIKVPHANLRTGPGTKYNRRYKVEKYTSFKYLTSKNGWARVMDEEGEKYWVSRKLIWVY